ncbi:MAG: hypothetical protein CMO81_05505 [Waddliaceae bacterium]|nr:hypothetical protein [Waddliaceae bacterium]
MCGAIDCCLCGAVESLCCPSEMSACHRAGCASTAISSCGISSIMGATLTVYLFKSTQDIAAIFSVVGTGLGVVGLSYVAYRYIFPQGVCGGCNGSGEKFVIIPPNSNSYQDV